MMRVRRVESNPSNISQPATPQSRMFWLLLSYLYIARDYWNEIVYQAAQYSEVRDAGLSSSWYSCSREAETERRLNNLGFSPERRRAGKDSASSGIAPARGLCQRTMARIRGKNHLPALNMAKSLLNYDKDHSRKRARIRSGPAVVVLGGVAIRNLVLFPIVLHLLLFSSRSIMTTTNAWMVTPSSALTRSFLSIGSRSSTCMIRERTSFRSSPSKNDPSTSSSSLLSVLHARRNKQSDSNDSGSLDSWYDPVDERATPDQVFWEEMERQNSLIGSSSSSSVGAGGIDPSEPEDAVFPGTAAADANRQLFASAGGTSSFPAAATAASSMSSSMMMGQQLQQQQGSFFAGSGNMPQPPTAIGENKIMTPKSVEAALARYDSFQVADNWLNEDLIELMAHQNMTESDEDFFKGVPSLEDQLDDWAKEDEDGGSISGDWAVPTDDPWDRWGDALKEDGDDDDDIDDESSAERIRIDRDDPRRQPSEFLFDDQDDEDHRTPESQAEQEEEEDYLERLSKLSVVSPRLERARDNPRAAAFFQREPDETEGFDRMWAAAIDNVCFSNLVGTFRNYGIQFCYNFGDWTDGSASDNFATIEDVASRKARLVYEVTGLPCIAARTSFEIEPVPDLGNSDSSSSSSASRSSAAQAALLNNPRVRSGYLFNDVGVHVDYLCDTLRPLSEPERVTCFKTCLCYYDGEMEVFDYGICDVDLHFANSLRTFIPVAQAINEMMKTLELTFGLEYQPWLRKRQDEVLFGSGGGGGGGGRASMKLRDRVLKEGKVLPNNIVDVSGFMDAMVDVDLMDDCAKELSERFIKEKPNKILTVATTGLVIALPMAKYLQVPVVYARKERSVVMADTYIAAYSSKTVGKNRELLVSKSHLHEDDRVLIVDDFLSGGSSQEAMLRIVSDAGATAVGVGVLLEKVYDSGRQSLSGFDVPIHSLCRIASVQAGVIQLVEEEGFDLMQKEKEKRSNESSQTK